MTTDLIFYWLFNILIIVTLVAVIYIIIILYRLNRVMKRWDIVSEKLISGLIEVIPAIVTANNVVKGFKKVFDYVEHKKEK